MEFLGDILGFIGTGGFSAIFGGITGLVGTYLTKREERLAREQDLKMQQLQNEHELKSKEIDIQIIDKEWEGRNQVAISEGQAREAEADAEAFAESFKLEPKQYSDPEKRSWFVRFILGILDFVRGLMRPALTIYLCVLTSKIYWTLVEMIEELNLLPTAEQINLTHSLIVNTILYLFTTCVTWWFGTRNKQKPPVVQK